MKTYYKIIELKDGILPKFLYHGVNKSKSITVGNWYTADEKMVKDGSSYEYKSGFHVFNNVGTATKYLKKFRDESKFRVIVEVNCKNVRRKGPRTEVLLARQIKFV